MSLTVSLYFDTRKPLKTAATQLLRTGTNLIHIKEALGHSDIKTTESYLASLNLDEQRKMSARL